MKATLKMSAVTTKRSEVPVERKSYRSPLKILIYLFYLIGGKGVNSQVGTSERLYTSVIGWPVYRLQV